MPVMQIVMMAILKNNLFLLEIIFFIAPGDYLFFSFYFTIFIKVN